MESLVVGAGANDITVAASIEILMLTSKFSLTRQENLLYAAWLLLGLSALVASIGVYIFLGIRAEKKKDTMQKGIQSGYTIRSQSHLVRKFQFTSIPNS
jgi:hypothetical protein